MFSKTFAVAFAIIGTQATFLKDLTDQMGSVPNTQGPVLAQTQADLETPKGIEELVAGYRSALGAAAETTGWGDFCIWIRDNSPDSLSGPLPDSCLPLLCQIPEFASLEFTSC